MTSPRLITLTTDFGLEDAYVAVMKAVILDLVPETRLIDVTHEIAPQNVAGGGYVIETMYRYFSPEAIHLAVVDPGVGTSRLPIAVRSPHGIFVGPDNGLFAPALIDQDAIDPQTGALLTAEVVELRENRYRRQSVSNTFHGRDIFAPAAAYLARGVQPAELGPALSRICVPAQTLPRQEGTIVRGTIVHIDHFGNAISNISSDLLPRNPSIELAGRTITSLSADYQERPMGALINSSGRLEVVARNSGAAQVWGIKVGDQVVVTGGQS